MPIIRVEKTENYSVINNLFLRRNDLSFRAKGLLAYLLSKPNDWKTTTKDLHNASSEGREATMKTVKELKQAGYIEIIQVKGDGGKIAKWEWRIYEVPKVKTTTLPETRNVEATRLPENQITEKPDYRKPVSVTKYCKKLSTDNTNIGDSLEFNEREWKKYQIDKIPMILSKPDLIKAWILWIDGLIELRKKPTTKTMGFQIKQLVKAGAEEAVIILGTSTRKGWTGLYGAKNNEERDLTIEFLKDNGIEVAKATAPINGKYIEPEGWVEAYQFISTKPIPDSFYDLADHFQRAVKEKLQQQKKS